MGILSFDKININKFWDRTPTVLKYILVFAIFFIVFYFLLSKNLDLNHIREIDTMKKGIAATNELIDNFENFKKDQDLYNKQILNYLHNLHILVEDLNTVTNRKINMILSSGDQNTEHIVEKIILLNESFEKLSKAYQKNIDTPNLDNKVKKDYQFQPEISVIPMDEKEKIKK